MSWNLHTIGKAPHVAAVVKSDPNVPDSIKALVASLCSHESAAWFDLLSFEGYGHGGSCKIELKQMQSAPAPVITKGYVS